MNVRSLLSPLCDEWKARLTLSHPWDPPFRDILPAPVDDNIGGLPPLPDVACPAEKEVPSESTLLRATTTAGPLEPDVLFPGTVPEATEATFDSRSLAEVL